jgi:flagellar hook-basal body complex protein FliE
MVMNIADALSAYKQGGGVGKALGSTGETGGAGSFSETLNSFANDAVKSLKEGEQAATSSATGKTDIASVVAAMNNAELMLDTVVGIRDKVIAAYQDIIHTAI